MKKWLIILGIITCMAGLTACGKQEQETDIPDIMSEDEAKNLVVEWTSTLDNVVTKKQESDFVSYISAENGWDASVLDGAVESVKCSAKEMGNYEEIVEITKNTMTYVDGYGSDSNWYTSPVE